MDRNDSTTTHRHPLAAEAADWLAQVRAGGDEPEAPQTCTLFVYGMLKRGYGLGQMIEEGGAVFLREAVLDGHSLYGGGIALMAPNEGGYVEGEVWEVPLHLMPQVDWIEGGYTRQPVTLRDGGTADAYIARDVWDRERQEPRTSWPFTNDGWGTPWRGASRFLPDAQPAEAQ